MYSDPTGHFISQRFGGTLYTQNIVTKGNKTVITTTESRTCGNTTSFKTTNTTKTTDGNKKEISSKTALIITTKTSSNNNNNAAGNKNNAAGNKSNATGNKNNAANNTNKNNASNNNGTTVKYEKSTTNFTVTNQGTGKTNNTVLKSALTTAAEFGMGLVVSGDNNLLFGTAQIVNGKRINIDSKAFYAGKVTGDLGSMVKGISTMGAGFAGETGGVALDATGVLSWAGVSLNVASATVVVAGTTLTLKSAASLGGDLSSLVNKFSSEGGSKPSITREELLKNSKNKYTDVKDLKDPNGNYANMAKDAGIDNFKAADYEKVMDVYTINGKRIENHYVANKNTGEMIPGSGKVFEVDAKGNRIYYDLK